MATCNRGRNTAVIEWNLIAHWSERNRGSVLWLRLDKDAIIDKAVTNLWYRHDWRLFDAELHESLAE